ncbi:MAG: PEP-CTERM sorting domain-containing protein [Verrucomicrobia bacterium]|nr:PEP-CTERM sorting domain-containing protein [Verrucomicrobiota bacterium]
MKNATILLCASAVCAGSVGAQVLYDIVSIPAPAGAEAYSWVGKDINNHGDVVGEYSAYEPGGVRNHIGAFMYSDSVGTPELAVEGKRGASATGINDLGQVALSTAEEDGTWRVMYRYTPGTGLEQLSTFGGRESETKRINASGQITGYSQVPGSNLESAFRDTPGSGMEEVGSLFGTSSVGYDINDAGWVTGASDGQNAFLWDSEGMTFIMPGVARGINNTGTVVGGSTQPWGATAFAYITGQLHLLGPLGIYSYALDVNSFGEVVGQVILNATIWTDLNEAQNLNSLIAPDSGWFLLTANAINDVGQITGAGIFNGQPMAFRLDPVPEPSTWALLSLAAGVSILWRKRRGKHMPHC